jgi:hypothetical protein
VNLILILTNLAFFTPLCDLAKVKRTPRGHSILRHIAFVTAFVLLSTAAQAENAARPFKLNVRGGIAYSFSDYPFALSSADGTTADSIATSDLGVGDFRSVSLAHDELFGSVGGELGFSYLRASGSDLAGDSSGAGNCTPGLFDLISLSHNQCMNSAATVNETTLKQVRAVATYRYQDMGLQVLAGLGYLDFSTESTGQMYYPGEFSAQSRNSSFSGPGLLLGARKDFGIIYGNTRLNLEGFVGAYRGDRDLKIDDQYEGTTGALTKSESGTAYTLELTASFLSDANWAGSGSQFEWGVSYIRAFDVFDSSNYNSAVKGTFGSAAATESTKDDFDAVVIFAGLTVPM